MLFFALFLTFGIIFSEALYGASMWWYFGLLLLFIIAFLLVAIFKKSRKSFYIPLAFIVGFIAMTAVNLQYNSVSVKDYTGSINAKVNSEIVFNGNYYSFDATDISVDGKTIKYEARVYAYVDEIDFSAGDVVSFYGRLRYYSHEKFDNYYPRKISSGQRYSLTAYSASKISDGQLNFPDNLQVRIKRILHQNLDDKTASIVQALVLGDKSGMDSSMYDYVKSSGLAHVLAVSGLHVSTLATAIYFVLKKLKVNPKISFAIVLPLKYLLVPFRLFVGLVGSVSFSTVSASASVFTVISLVCLMVFVSRFVFLDRVKKARGACIILCVGMLMRSLLLAVG